jgi:hypothetical protein
VGKASRRKRQDALFDEATPKEQYRRVLRNDRRGRRVGTDLADYEAICVEGPDRVAEALIARYTGRMDRLRMSSDHELSFILEAMLPVTALDIALIANGSSPSRPPQAYWGSWPDRLSWGVESCVTAIRLLFCGQVLGAAVVARTQLERWTFLRAAVAKLKQDADEDTADYIARVWSTTDALYEAVLNMDSDEELPASVRATVHESDGQTHDHIKLSDGVEICPALMWSLLSEIMHGRELQGAVAWDSVELMDNAGWTEEYWHAVATVRDTIRLCLRQLSLTAADLAEKRGGHSWSALLLANMDSYSEPDSDRGRRAIEQSWKAQWRRQNGVGPDVEVPEEAVPAASTMVDPVRSPSAIMFAGHASPPQATMIPLTPNEGLSSTAIEAINEQADLYRRVLNGEFPAGRRYRDDELATVCFVWHRSRYVSSAMQAMRAEQAQLGEDFNAQGLTNRWTTAMVVTEAASMSARWFPVEEMRHATFLMGAGLRSAWWLWLEDDDRAMSILRVVLEQCARLRTWRLKPDKARRLEERGELTTPRDWLEAAGWKRLTALNRALGEFAHAMPRSDWSGARELLAMLQEDAEPDKAIYTARGAALSLISEVVADEIVGTVQQQSADVAAAFAEVFSNVGIDLPLDAEARFNHIWKHRSTNSAGARQFASAPGVPPPGSALFKPKSRMHARPDSVSSRGVAGIVKVSDK